MRCNDNVCVPTACMLFQFGSKPLHEFMVEAILWFLNSYEWIRIRILHEQKVRKHLQRTIAHVGRIKWIFVSLLVKRQQQSAISTSLVLDVPNTRNAACDFFEYFLKSFRVRTLHVL